MVTCADTSFLFSLYGNDGNTPHAVAWLKSHRMALTPTTLNEYELGNALRFAEFSKGIGPGARSHAPARPDARPFHQKRTATDPS
jgi:hypothetical protein